MWVLRGGIIIAALLIFLSACSVFDTREYVETYDDGEYNPCDDAAIYSEEEEPIDYTPLPESAVKYDKDGDGEISTDEYDINGDGYY
jgi:hypothetical protein